MFKLKKEKNKQSIEALVKEMPWHYRLHIQRYDYQPITILEEGKENIMQIQRVEEGYEVTQFNPLTNDFSCVSYNDFHSVLKAEKVLGYNVEFEMDEQLKLETRSLRASEIKEDSFVLKDFFQPRSLEMQVGEVTIYLDKTWDVHIKKLSITLLTLCALQDTEYEPLLGLLKEFYNESEIDVTSQIEEGESPTTYQFYQYLTSRDAFKKLEMFEAIERFLRIMIRMQNSSKGGMKHDD